MSKDPPVLEGFSEGLTEFVSKCLQKSPTDRLSARELLEHKFMEKAYEGKEMYMEMLSRLNCSGELKL
jgi:serine/threonine protein kinase